MVLLHVSFIHFIAFTLFFSHLFRRSLGLIEFYLYNIFFALISILALKKKLVSQFFLND
jgi:hypothetical protein